MRIVALISLFFTLLASCASAQVNEDEGEFIASFPSAWLALLLYSENDLKKEEIDLSCFDVYLREREAERMVVFLPTDLVKTEGDNIEFRLGFSTKCGPSVAYHFDRKNGNFVQKTYQR